MKVVADERVAALEETFGRHAEIIALDGQAIRRMHLLDADALIVRSVTRVDRGLLDGTPVQFIGTATIGFDHLDRRYLESAGITWASAPGCNADATAQYTLAIYMLACRRLRIDPLGQRYGIVGRGNVGSRIQRLLDMTGVVSLACDPPLQEAGESRLVSMDEILDCDIISLHVPLTRSGRWPTMHMISAALLDQIPGSALLINTARGDVVEGRALARWIASGGNAALDVWPGEPDIDGGMLEGAVVATPHIAGYSLDGKMRASAMVYEAFCAKFGFSPKTAAAPDSKKPSAKELRGLPLLNAILDNSPVEDDDRDMRRLLTLPPEQRQNAFSALRSNYVLRRDLFL